MAGPGIRAWELARAVARAGHTVTLAAPRAQPPGDAPSAPHAQPPGGDASVDQGEDRLELMAYSSAGDELREAAGRAEVVLVQSLVLANHPFLAALDKPLACDLYDPFVLENLPGRAGMAVTRRTRRDQGDIEALRALLARGDFFLCASTVQRDFWLGALAGAGRVNAANYEHDPSFASLLDVVAFGIPAEPPVPAPPALKGVVPGIAGTDIVALWGGGIWNWLDPLTLLRAAARVADNHPLRIVFMGTATPSPHEPGQEMARAARREAQSLGLDGRVAFFREGWVPYAERGGLLLEADIGVSCHRPLVESRFAFRTRLLDCIWAGLPIVATEGDALSEVIRTYGLGETAPPEDPVLLAGALVTAIERTRAGGRASFGPAFAAVRTDYLWDRVAAPLVRFVAERRTAPDRTPAAAGELTATASLPAVALRMWREEGLLATAEETLRYLRWRTRS
jgi:glycosyltransferase involved in cell wall biosynthesis